MDIKADKTLDTVFKNNREWVETSVAKDPNYFSRFREGQNPQILWIGCSDARVPANRLMGLDVGDVFVVRNIANQVLNTDMSMMSVVQYAVNVLQIPHIIVCGHYDCGGVRASMANTDHTAPLENWLRNIRDTQRIHRTELEAIEDVTAKQRRLVELNVVEQCISLYKTGVVQRKRMESYSPDNADFTEPRIHAMVYDPTTGFLNQVPMDFGKIFEEVKDIYNLYQPDQNQWTN
ncbi:carbonic anhydrase [Pelagophyceae sp. CCMP2097]|nr:carbonic anhydrase [Pelagophyceae sp. CCMP2097]